MNSTSVFPALIFRIVPKCKLLKRNKRLLLGFSEFSRVVRMRNSCVNEEEGSELFCSKNELIKVGKLGFAEGIIKSGGWMSMGWDGEKDDGGGCGGDGEVKTENGLVQSYDFDMEKCDISNVDGDDRGISGLSDSSFSSESQEVESEDVSGIDGVLHRLKRRRDISFDEKNKSNDDDPENSNVNHQSSESLKDAVACIPDENELASLSRDEHMFRGNALDKCYSNTSSSFLKADSWRAWSFQRAMLSSGAFEAAEIDIGESPDKKTVDNSMVEPIAVPCEVGVTKEFFSHVKEVPQSDVKGLLQHLQLELSSALQSLNLRLTYPTKVKEHSSEDAKLLSDASVFWENKIMYTQFKLRSMRAKLAIIQGKTVLAITDAQKILKEKQKQIDDARQTLKLLRTTCIVWPNSGSEVLLTGSFDGWATQWKMEKTSSGIFALFLKLYPGQYEFKFIMDGVWMVDPLRPIVNHGGFENNLLIIF